MNHSKKNSPAIRMKGFTDAWEQRKVKDFSEKVLEKNTNYNFSETFTNSAEFGVVSQRDFFDKDISNKENLSNYYIVENDDFIYNPRISNFAPVGPIKRNKLGRSGVMSPLYYVFRVYNTDHQFLEYFFETSKWHTFMKLNGDSGARADRFSIKDHIFCEMPIMFPTLEEQTQIGNFFKQLDETITLHKRTLEKHQNLKKFYLEKMFPKENEQFPEVRFPNFTDAWEQRKLGEVSYSYSGGTPNIANPDYYDGEIPFIRSGDIHSLKTELYISQEGIDNSAAKLVSKGDILYALYGATSGEVNRAKLDGAINQAVLAIIPNSDNDPEFIMQYLKKKQLEIIKTYLQGGQGNLSGTIVQNIILTKPKTLKEQTQIGNFFKQLDETITLHKRKVEKFEKIKQAYLEKMFI